MAADWSTLRELLLPVPGARRRGLEAALRDAVRTGRLRPGTRLPSSRDLAAQLGLARGTVTAAYDQLVAEGRLTTRHGSGTWVAEHPPSEHGPRASGTVNGSGASGTGNGLGAAASRGWRFDLGPGLPSLAAFPRAEWNAASRAGLAALSDAELGYPDPAGHPPLRAELAAYLGRVRGVTARPDEVVVTNGTFEALALLAALLVADGHTAVALEDPGNPEQFELLRLHGLRPVAVPTDEHGLRVDALARTGCRAVLVTAAHQYPTGVALSPERRAELLDWARASDGLVIEDDYDAEYRYDRPAQDALQAAASDHVAYLGTLSKTLAPALRLGWMAVPSALRGAVAERKRLSDRGSPTLPQAAFADLLRSGAYDRHLRRTRRLYKGRRATLIESLAHHLPEWRPQGIAAGLHVVLRLPDGCDDAEVTARLARAGIRVAALSSYVHEHPADPGLVLGWARLSPDRIRNAIAAIADA
ncbi:MocR-like pyridoxine biosynthesis transcription factor PdxR [Actinomadura rupiterrae]|uniref:MocR-like pyridoxine biosynthesis transcription factor PdxR n=1 Tax=Actinomadura rupiterrae TaxID=559627 RepID=UPI0020A57C33|nr:PLP-dependent aminotransferase family protein [Actinomadura rupiterrae]MCP2343227.1 GntR family transcriptional regulator/MocR family aminotransferase [Actinomadura rupiterrae]